MTQTKEISSHALAAKNVRKELKANFPTTKFRVTTKSYSMGSSLSVYWTDGPTTKAVRNIIGKYEYGSFDGQEDMYNYKKGFDSSKGDVKYAQATREYSLEALQKLLADNPIKDSGAVVRGGYSMSIETTNYQDREYYYILLRDLDLQQL